MIPEPSVSCGALCCPDRLGDDIAGVLRFADENDGADTGEAGPVNDVCSMPDAASACSSACSISAAVE